MVTYVLPPGAWLSGSDLHPAVTGSSPLQPAVTGHSPLQPAVTGHSPLQPPIKRYRSQLSSTVEGADAESSESPAAQLADAAARLTAAAPWHGGTSSWAYRTGGDAMMAVAIDRVRSRLVRETDPRREGKDEGRIKHPPGWGKNKDALWRWGDEFRNQAVMSDLNWRFAAEDRCLWFLDRSTNSGLVVRYAQSMLLSPLGNGDPYRWYDEQADKVLRAAVHREDRLPEILAQAEDIMPFFYNLTGLDPGRAQFTANLLSIAQMWATPLIMALKNQVALLRPYMVSSRIVPVIETPAHGALPSGHATISSLMSALLRSLIYRDTLEATSDKLTHPKVLQLDRLARRIAFNRVVAGVHFPMDSAAGYALGLQMAAHLIGLASDSGRQPKRFDPFDPANNARKAGIRLSEDGKPKAPQHVDWLASRIVTTSGPWCQVWEKARDELETLGLRDRGGA